MRGPSWTSLAEHEFPLLLAVALLLVAMHAVFLWRLQDSLASPARVEAYRKAGFTVTSDSARRLTVSYGFKDGRTVRRALHETVFSPQGYGLVAGVALAALLCGLAMQVVAVRCRLRHRDQVLLPIVLMLAGVGIVLLQRLSLDIPHTWPGVRYPAALDWPLKQAAVLCAAFLLFPVFVWGSHLLERRDWLQEIMRKRLAGGFGLYFILPLLAVLLLVFTGLAGQADFSHTLAVRVGGFRVQVVELVKPLLVFFMAYFLADLEASGQLEGMRWFSRPRASLPVLVTAAVVVAAALYFTEDLGLALICVAFLVCAVVIGTGEGAVFLLAGLGLAVCVALMLWIQRPIHAYHRFMALADPFGFGEELARVRWGIAAGGFWGTGIEAGMPFDYRNADSDFILAAIAEEMGLAGVVIVLGAIGCLVYRGLLIARREEEPFRKHLACAIVTLFAVQTVVIAGGNLGILPLTGLQLFFVARGGVGCLVNMALVAVLYQIGFVYPPRGPAMQPYTGQWDTVNLRLRWAGLAAAAAVFLLVVRAGWLMLGRADEDRVRPFLDREKTAIVRHMIAEGVFREGDDGVAVDPGALPRVVEQLGPAAAARVNVAAAALDGRPLAWYARLLRVGKDGLYLPPWTFTIGNPRLRQGRAAYRIVDRDGKPLAETRRGRRRYPEGEAAFAVTGQSRVGRAGFLERDARELIARIDSGRYLYLDWTGALQRIRAVLAGRDIGRARKPAGEITIVTTIDRKVQRAAFRSLARRDLRGAVIVMGIPDGEILALVSRPAFDPDQKLDLASWDAAFADPRRMLSRNRALHVRYPPGSVFKPLVAAAMLESRPELAAKTIRCRGEDRRLRIHDAGFRNGRGKRHGTTGLDRALTYSCNVYFARKAVALGAPPIQRLCRRLGFGGSVSLVPLVADADLSTVPAHVLDCTALAGSDDPPRECDGAPGGQAVADEYFDRYPGLLARAGIGQTVVEVTPMQVAMLYSAIANGGKMVYPRIVKMVARRTGRGWTTLYRSADHAQRVFSRATADRLTQALRLVYEKGTASRRTIPLRLDARGRKGRPYGLRSRPLQPVAVAAKTGTAQVAGKRPHAWFAAFAPAEDPRVLVVVLVENGGSGGLVAGNIGIGILRDALRVLAQEREKGKRQR